MNEQLDGVDSVKISPDIADRHNVFYWQTDRAVEPEQAGYIWADRHRYFTDDELISRVNTVLDHDSLIEIEPLDPNAQTNLGNVNSVRIGRLISDKEVVIRCHPKGVKNGYFHVESVAAQNFKNAGLPGYDTFVIHDYSGGNDFAFQVIERLPGTAIKKWLEIHSDDEVELLLQIGNTMKRLHQIRVSGFGPFDNEKAKSGELVGLHKTFSEAVRAGLPFNLDVLKKYGVLNEQQSEAVAILFENNPLLDTQEAVLVHNDFADWNLLTDGQGVTGVLDWDECVGGIPESDIACWSTFFDPDRLKFFLDGYFGTSERPYGFYDRFELMRLRYTVSKMTLRLRRYSWEPTDFMQKKIEAGKTALAQSMEYFGL